MHKQALLLLCVPLLCAGACKSVDVGPRSNLSDAQAAQARAACQFQAGTLPGLSLAKDAPLGPEIPINNIVVLIFENRSFDHLLGNLPQAGQPDAEVAPAGVTNPDDSGKPIARFHEEVMCFEDTSHSWNGEHIEWNNGKNDGFVKANAIPDGAEPVPPDGTRAMGYYDQTDLPYLYGLATTFAIGDHYFQSVLGPTYPNRDFANAATSFGHTSNNLFTDIRPTIQLALDGASVNWIDYYTNAPGPAVFLGSLAQDFDHLEPIAQFFTDAQAGMLPPVSWVDPELEGTLGAGRTDFHPPGDPQSGEAFLKTVVSALMASPQWPHTALFVTFDENGGLYDHMPPPPACPPDDIAPILEGGDLPGDFARYGFRVPLIVISPYAKAHYVSHTIYDHTSILRFIEARFKLTALTRRDANADPLYDLFDFHKTAFAKAPTLPEPMLDQKKLDDCLVKYPPKDGGDINFGAIDLSTPHDMAAPDLAVPMDAGTVD